MTNGVADTKPSFLYETKPLPQLSHCLLGCSNVLPQCSWWTVTLYLILGLPCREKAPLAYHFTSFEFSVVFSVFGWLGGLLQDKDAISSSLHMDIHLATHYQKAFLFHMLLVHSSSVSLIHVYRLISEHYVVPLVNALMPLPACFYC